ncbi:Transcriptional repressor SmtB [Paraburkholderia humisilvae]|uniref:Transcriptional repressor SmtB n=2 Tax=Paraburkholderia humisilvae TaxID=627669 RepID=A0A6J5D7K9_9BURK|nr:metalloregulator ArsR/SmtB family transcription factor [Paraburkholderia humisilvae]CAB3749092.1 Transcriptional repressor SmtB [Paraburkholderia humisilvae]
MAAHELTDDRVVELAEMFRLMGDPSRLKIIVACLNAPMCVSDIAAKYGMSQPLVSHHLRLLRAARVLRAERRGKQVFYEAADDHVKRVIGDMTEHVCEQPVPEVIDIEDAPRR